MDIIARIFDLIKRRYKTADRMALLGKTIEKLRPTIITFQEVTSKNIGFLKEQKWFSRYTMIPNELLSNQGYGVVILTVYPVVNWRSVPFKNSRMGRYLLLAELKVEFGTQRNSWQTSPSRGYSPTLKDVYITVATSHLESMAYTTLEREKQLQQSLEILNDYDNVCLMGDLNLELKVDGEIQLPHAWFDAWLSINNNTHLNGITWDPDNNPYVKMSEPESTHDRFDRVLCKLKNFGIESIDIVGKKSENGIFLSDHYALYTRLKFGSTQTLAHKSPLVNKVRFIRPKNWKTFTH
ncbi:Tyrosyl-DNA phosphodiesterase 2 [Exaiptasia diaphana]|nr:Tyrosyl-DNA phosphodiesterase 2 [Exaiptasia diaphana]